jgi:hypothetical protein
MSQLPCQSACYLHRLYGGPRDGDTIPAKQPYEYITLDNEHRYDQDGEPEPTEKSGGWQVINCTDEYSEPLFFNVRMKYVPNA